MPCLIALLALASLAFSSPHFPHPLVGQKSKNLQVRQVSTVSPSSITAVSSTTAAAISASSSSICPDGFGKVYTDPAGDFFTAECSTDFSHGEDLAIILDMHSLEDCLQSCSAYNQRHSTAQCIGATFYKPYNACYLKSSAHNSYKEENTDSGILVLKASSSGGPTSSSSSTEVSASSSTGATSSSSTASTSEIPSVTTSESASSTSSSSSSSVLPTSRFAHCPNDNNEEYTIPEGAKYRLHCSTDLLGFSVHTVPNIYSLSECIEKCYLYTKAKCIAVTHQPAQRECDLKVQLEDSLWTEGLDSAVLIPGSDPAYTEGTTSSSESSTDGAASMSSSAESVLTSSTAQVPSTSSPVSQSTSRSVSSSSSMNPLSSSSSTVSVSVSSTLTSSSSASAPSTSATEVTSSNVLVASNATDACTILAVGSGPVPYPDTVEAFREYGDFATAAMTAQPPSGYVQAFLNLGSAVRGNNLDPRGLHLLTAYDTITCADICDDTKDCNAFNVYIERDPTLNPGRKCPNPASTTNYKCSLWRLEIGTHDAKDGGDLLYAFQQVIVASNGYNRFHL